MHNPTFLIHGIADTSAKMKTMSTFLQNEGIQTYLPSLTPSSGKVGLDMLAQQLNEFIYTHAGDTQPVNIVAFSMGGLVSRYYLQRLGGLSRGNTFITLGTPHYGSIWAHCVLGEGCKQMRPNSDFIRDLNRDREQLSTINFVNIWTPYDLMIVPAKHCQIDVGKEILASTLRHDWLVKDKDVLNSITARLHKSF